MSWPKTPEHGHAKLGDKPAAAEGSIMTNQQEAPKSTALDGKNFSQPEGVYTLLKDLTDDHLIAICETQTHLPEYILEVFRNEQLFRKENSNE